MRTPQQRPGPCGYDRATAASCPVSSRSSGIPVRIVEKAHVEHQIGDRRHAARKAEAGDRDGHLRRCGRREAFAHRLLQIVAGESRWCRSPCRPSAAAAPAVRARPRCPLAAGRSGGQRVAAAGFVVAAFQLLPRAIEEQRGQFEIGPLAQRASPARSSSAGSNPRVRESKPMASGARDCSSGLSGLSIRRSSRRIGKLSIVSQPRSSSTFSAVVLPAPSRPVTSSSAAWRGSAGGSAGRSSCRRYVRCDCSAMGSAASHGQRRACFERPVPRAQARCRAAGPQPDQRHT